MIDARTHTDIIDALGGKTQLAREIGVEPSRALHWHTRGIPAKFWPAVERVCRGKGIAVTTEMLAEMPRSAARGPMRGEAA